MSTILQALKRLEKEQAVRTTPTQPAMLQSFDTRQVLHRAAAFTWLRGRVLTWSVAALAISAGAIAWHLYSRSGPPGPQMPPPSTHGVQQAAVPSGARPSVVADATPRTKSPPLQDGPFGSEDQRVAPVQPPVAPPVVQIPRPDPERVRDSPYGRSRSPAIRPSAVAPPGDEDISTRQSAATGSPATTDAAAAADRAAPTRQAPGDYAGAERLTDGRLTIQAIAWSSNAEDRMAVINNRVVREGAAVDGFSIIGIAEEAIYAREGGRLWKVLFGRP